MPGGINVPPLHLKPATAVVIQQFLTFTSTEYLCNTFLANSIVTDFLQLFGPGIRGPSDTLQECSKQTEEYKEQHIHLTFLLTCEMGDL